MADSVTIAKAKLQWKSSSGSGEMACQFNPAELSITKAAKWNSEAIKDQNAPKVSFAGGEAATYSLNLFFDGNTSSGGKDVRSFTNKLLLLTLRGGGKAKATEPDKDPPVVTFVWGSITLFKSVVTNVNISYTMFDPDGTPIRATAKVDFKQFDQSDDVTPSQNPTSRSDPRKTYIAHSGQRLDQIAYEEYADARYWRLLAEANHLDNPFQLTDGQLLVIPPVE